MKRSFKILSVVLFFILVFNLINFESVSAEIETKADSKFDCLSDYGGEIAEVEYGTNNDWGGKVTMNVKGQNQYNWEPDFRVIEVGVYSKSLQTLKEVNYRIYTNDATLCTGSLADVDTSKQSIKFKAIFKQTGWFYFEVTGVDTSREGAFDSTHREVKIDKEPPVISDVKFEVVDKTLKIQFNIKDGYSGINSMNVSWTGPDGSEITRAPVKFSGGDNERNVWQEIPIDVYGDGNYNVKIEAKDKIGNSVNPIVTYTLSTLDLNGNRASGEISPIEIKEEKGLTKEEQDQKKDQEKEEQKNAPLGDDPLNGDFSISTDKRNFACDQGLTKFIHDFWKWVLILTPALLMVMCTIDFIRALTSSDADALKKAGTNTVKRVVAILLLICLPVILNAALNLMGIEFCW